MPLILGDAHSHFTFNTNPTASQGGYFAQFALYKRGQVILLAQPNTRQITADRNFSTCT